jgi:hypothetical protein
MLLPVLGVVLAGASALHAQSMRQVPVFVNGGRLESEALLLQEANRTVVPMRALFESLGARVEWDAGQRAVYAWKPDGIGVRLGLGERFAQSLRMSASPAPGNWGTITAARPLDAAAMLIDGRVFVPLRFASEALSADVRYASTEPAVYIRTEAVAGAREEPPPVRPPVDRNPNRLTARELARALDVDLILQRDQVRLGRNRSVPLRLAVRNRSDQTLTVPTGGQEYDFEILQDGRVVWNWAHGRAFIMILRQRGIRPGEELEFTARWDMVDNRGRAVAPGNYTVRGVFVTAVRNGRLSDQAALTIVE